MSVDDQPSPSITHCLQIDSDWQAFPFQRVSLKLNRHIPSRYFRNNCRMHLFGLLAELADETASYAFRRFFCFLANRICLALSRCEICVESRQLFRHV